MQIEIPHDLFQRIQQRVGPQRDPIEVIRMALDHLDFQDRELAAIQEGIEAAERGEVQSLEDFDREFRERNGLAPRA